MHIGLVIWGILETRGGLQRVGADLAAGLSKRGHRITVFTKAFKSGDPVYALPETINIIPLPLTWDKRLDNAQSAIRDSKVDVLVAMFSWKDLMWFPWLLKDTGIPLVCSEHNYPPIISHERWRPSEHFGCLAAADHIHVLLEGYKRFYPYPLQERITVIANPAPKPHSVNWEQRARKSSRTIIAVGRFVESHKQFLLLIKAFAGLAAGFPEWSLVICGDGPDLEACRSAIKALNVTDRISLPGDIADIDCRYAAADIFCIPSRHEGFPMTMGEAAAHGLPLVGFAGCPGVNALIEPGKNGVLAQGMEMESLAAALRSVMEASAETRQAMGQEAQKKLARFDADLIYNQWEELLTKAAAAQGQTVMQSLPSDLAFWTRDRLTEAALEITSRAHPFMVNDRLLSQQHRELQRAHQKLLTIYKNLPRQYNNPFFAWLKNFIKKIFK